MPVCALCVGERGRLCVHAFMCVCRRVHPRARVCVPLAESLCLVRVVNPEAPAFLSQK